MPTADKVLRGTARKGRELPDELTFPVGCPEPPSDLGENGRRMWAQAGPLLAQRGVMTVGDGGGLEGLCRAYDAARFADAMLKKQGHVVVGSQGPTRSPWEMMSVQRWAEFRKFAIEFGLTPSARSRIHAPGKPEGDSGEDFMFGALKVVNGGRRGR